MEYQDINSDISYVNKDFNSIYTELLDTAKKLSNKWDPSLSNESDPGVVLLKLNALIADKNNYNIDKNILECFPLSVTQLGNARRLYNMLGYNLSYYLSARGTIYIQYKQADNSTQSIEIPKWTQISDTSGEIFYTTLQDILVTANSTDQPVEVEVIQGIRKQYRLNNRSTITLNDLDSDLRLYFSEYNVAENGIFITNLDGQIFEKVDNLSVHPLDQLIYQFGIMPGTNTCYVQFPKSIAQLIAGGLTIEYILTDGINGNIKANILTKIVDDIVIENSEGETSTINGNLRILQPNSIKNGADIEDLDSAYKNYTKTIGTFNTLVTTRDYENFIYSALDSDNVSPLVSNVRVADRTSDLNYTNYIQTKRNLIQNRKLLQVTKDGDEDMLNAYQIQLYLLNRPPNLSSIDDYNLTFVKDSIAIDDIEADERFDSVKSVQHDLLAPQDTSKFIFLNKFKLNGTLITHQKVTKKEKEDIEKNVQRFLINEYNSRNLEFGVQIDYDKLISNIQKADNRIKTVILDTLNYTPYLLEAAGESHNMYNSTEIESIDEANELVARMILAGNIQLFKFDDFAYEFGQTRGTLIESADKVSTIQSISTEVKIILDDNNSNTYTLQENESVQVLKPHTDTIKQYSSYVSYIVNAPAGSSATTLDGYQQDSDYLLPEGWSISLSYTDANGVTHNNEYIASNTIINSNLDLNAAIGQTKNTGASGYIQTKAKSVAKLPKNTKFYIITNHISIQKDDLDRDIRYMTLDIAPQSSYILDNNEYFIYSNATSTELILLSSGTELTNDSGEAFHAQTPQIDISDITTEDIDNIEWLTLAQELTTTKLDITLLGEDTTISTAESLTIDNDPYPLTTELTYNATNGAGVINPGPETKIQSRLALNIAANQPQVIADNHTYTFIMTDQSRKIVDSALNDRLLFNHSIVGQSGEDIDAQVLTNSGTSEYSLKAYTYTAVTIEETEAIPNIYESNTYGYILSPKAKPADSNVTWTLPFTFNAVDPLNVGKSEFAYVVPVSININSTSNTCITFKAGADINLQLFPYKESGSGATVTSSGTYLVVIPPSATAINGFTIESNQELTKEEFIGVGQITRLTGYNIDEINSLAIDHTILNSHTGDVYFYDLLGYGGTSGRLNIDQVLEKMAEIDTGNKFDWTYRVPEEDKVLYPLLGQSYWDINHIYNRYTLPQIDFNHYNIQVSGSSILKGE